MAPRRRMRKVAVTLGQAPLQAPSTSAPEVRAPSPDVGVRATRVLLTPRELAARLKVSPITVGRMLRAGELPFIRVGKRARFELDDVITKLRGR